MKINNKARGWILSVCVTLVVAVSVLGTLTYLTSQSQVVNTFTVGRVAIRLDEAKVDTDGVPVEGAERVSGNEYHLLPGRTYTKDPTVTVLSGSEDSYVRMLVTVNNTSELKAIFGADFFLMDCVSGWDSTVWLLASTTDNGDNTITYEFRYKEIVGKTDTDFALDALFDTLTLPGDKVTGEQLATIADLEIIAQAHAIQAPGFDTADVAWAAFDIQANR